MTRTVKTEFVVRGVELHPRVRNSSTRRREPSRSGDVAGVERVRGFEDLKGGVAFAQQQLRCGAEHRSVGLRTAGSCVLEKVRPPQLGEVADRASGIELGNDAVRQDARVFLSSVRSAPG